MRDPADLSQPSTDAWQALNEEAVALGKQFYIDPATGFMVWTELHHKKRGHCCQSGCRHCPFGFQDRIKACQPG